MDFEDSTSEAAFRKEARAWLEANARPAARTDAPRALFTSQGADDLPDAKRFQHTLAEARLAAITWPAMYGGRGGTVIEHVIFDEEAASYDIPSSIFMVGMGLAGPTIIAHGTPEQKERFLGPMLRGEEVWCQLFSEPGAGSDLAGMRTRAIRDGDTWVVNGQKVWNSGAQYSDWGILPVRTDPDQPKHRGISYFLVDMATPGITVRPLRQITGDAHFSEVFLDDVPIPAQNLLGELNGGWAVTQTTLMNERMMIGGGDMGVDPALLVQLARGVLRDDRTASDDPVVRQKLADIHIGAEIIRFLRYRSLTALGKGEIPGPEGSITKLAMGQLLKRAGELALELQGPAGTLVDGSAPAEGAWQGSFLTAPSLRIAGGTDEIQRNIIGERVLGLPREPDPNHGAPFASYVAS
jgi:alkylation response protein AidB-like acyl-CoA dehydrogenase